MKLTNFSKMSFYIDSKIADTQRKWMGQSANRSNGVLRMAPYNDTNYFIFHADFFGKMSIQELDKSQHINARLRAFIKNLTHKVQSSFENSEITRRPASTN